MEDREKMAYRGKAFWKVCGYNTTFG